MSTEPVTLWDEFDAMAFNLKQQAHAPGVSALEGRTMLAVAGRIEDVLKRYPTEMRQVTETGPTPLVLLPDLLAAIERARGKAKERWHTGNPGFDRAAWYGAGAALELLGRALTPDRGGAGAPSPAPSEPDVAASPPAPSLPILCGAGHPSLDLQCTLVADHTTAIDHYSAVHGVWWKDAPRCASRHHSNQGESACIGEPGHAGDHWDGLGVTWP